MPKSPVTARLLGAAALVLALTGPIRAEEPAASTVVAVVNGTEITLGHMIALRETLPPQYQTLADDVLFNGILEQLIQQAALAQSVEQSITPRDMLFIENDRRSYLAGKVLDEAATAGVTDEAVQAAYDAKYSAENPVKEYHAAHILVATKEEADAIKAELDGGADFAEVAKTKSTDGSAANGGDLGWFNPSMMVKPFADAVVAAEIGTVVGPIETEFGWHLIRVSEDRIPEAPTLDVARPEIEAELRQKAVEAKIEGAVDGAEVTRSVDGIDPAILKNTALLDN